MAPTEILAEQHFRTVRALVEPLGLTVAWLSAGQRSRERQAALEALRSGTAAIGVGTHALIQDAVELQRLGLAVVDEQHRFGVLQRASLRGKGEHPHVLVMTATPIPRTLALTLYGDLDVSVLDQLPPGRTPIVTKVRHEPAAGADLRLHPGRAPGRPPGLRGLPARRGDRGERSEGRDRDGGAPPGRPVPRVPGGPDPRAARRSTRRTRIMRAFKAGELDLLVATTVIEVGIDVPNASVMLIEHAERFGLAQLHQLRGRVGRGAAKSFCILLASGPMSDEGQQRLEAMASHPGRVPARRGRPPDPRPRRVLRDAPVGPAGVPHREPRDPRAAPRGGAPGRRAARSCAIPASASRSIAPSARRSSRGGASASSWRRSGRGAACGSSAATIAGGGSGRRGASRPGRPPTACA